jgi:hypothetical protein
LWCRGHWIARPIAGCSWTSASGWQGSESRLIYSFAQSPRWRRPRPRLLHRKDSRAGGSDFVNDEVRRWLKKAMEDLRVVVHEMALAPETSASTVAGGPCPPGDAVTAWRRSSTSPGMKLARKPYLLRLDRVQLRSACRQGPHFGPARMGLLQQPHRLAIGAQFGQASRMRPGSQGLHPSCLQRETAAGATPPGDQPHEHLSPVATTWRRSSGASPVLLRYLLSSWSRSHPHIITIATRR